MKKISVLIILILGLIIIVSGCAIVGNNDLENNNNKGGPIQYGECGNNVCDNGENTPSYPFYCPEDCIDISSEDNIQLFNNESADANFYLVSDKDNYELGEKINIRLLPREIISYFDAKEVLGEEITFILTRPDESIVKKTAEFPPEPRMNVCDPTPDEDGCLSQNVDFSFQEVGVSFLYEYITSNLKEWTVSEGDVSQSGWYKVTTIPNVVAEYYFSVSLDRINSFFINQASVYSLKGRRKIPYVSTARMSYDKFIASYSYKNQNLHAQHINVYIIIPVLSKDINDYKYFVAIGDSTVTKKAQFINRSNQGVNFSSPNANGYFNYFWVSDNTIILIEGFGVKNFGDEEKSFVDEYLKKYPSSL